MIPLPIEPPFRPAGTVRSIPAHSSTQTGSGDMMPRMSETQATETGGPVDKDP